MDGWMCLADLSLNNVKYLPRNGCLGRLLRRCPELTSLELRDCGLTRLPVEIAVSLTINSETMHD